MANEFVNAKEGEEGKAHQTALHWVLRGTSSSVAKLGPKQNRKGEMDNKREINDREAREEGKSESNNAMTKGREWTYWIQRKERRWNFVTMTPRKEKPRSLIWLMTVNDASFHLG
jgi:hypothetical protein